MTLQAIRRLPQRWSPFYASEIAAKLAESLYTLKISEGYEKIVAYFASADWNNSRDQEFFRKIDSLSKYKSEIIEAYYLALIRLPPNEGFTLGGACSMFHRRRGLFGDRDEPRFVGGVLSAVTRIEQEKANFFGKDVTRHNCETTLVSQLLDDRLREAFLTSLLDQLSRDERRTLDPFLAAITPPVADVIAQFS
jgi:hypothetical protein